MAPETIILNQSLAWLTFIANVLVLLIIFSLVFKKLEFSRKFLRLLKRFSYEIVFLFSTGGILGSLVYSEVVGFTPCLLCWIQRIFLYPIAILTFVAILKKEKVLGDYILSLSIPGAIVALYHSFTQLGGPSLASCTDASGECSIVYFVNFGYITIPFMAFSAFILITLVIFIGKYFRS